MVDSHVDGVVDDADDRASDFERGIHGAGGEEGEEEDVEDTGDEVDDQNREKLEREVELEVLHASPMLVVDLLGLGKDEINFPEAELFVHFEEGFEVEAAADAVVEADRIVVPDLLMGVDDAHTFHNIDAHTVLHGHMPPRNLQR